MRHYQNILYVSRGTTDEREGLKQALSLARNNQALLTILVISPTLPRAFADHQKKYDDGLLAQTEVAVKTTKASLQLAEDAVAVEFKSISHNTPAIKIIQHVMQVGHDLVIKEAEPRDKKGGFKAVDMDLLRKCPVPVWLCQPISAHRQDIKVAVAIDPDSQGDAAAEQLSKRMLELARSLADSCSGSLHIISCWDYIFEEYLRSNAYVKISDDEIAETLNQAEQEHLKALEKLMESAGVSDPYQLHHLRGHPSDVIPDFIKESGINILVMGTVARTGIPGFMIGNTAENIVQKLSCSLMALKPAGFVSPVKLS